MRQLTEDAAAALREIFATRLTPKAIYRADRCRACSLVDLCRPKAMERSASLWRDRMLASLLQEDAAS
ncbi:hypothetical protein ASD64_20250 [Mesorhizobium sp. Root157]|nr:hypothetical protein ASD64_20250 [Mesorhizobium sp. Root157]